MVQLDSELIQLDIWKEFILKSSTLEILELWRKIPPEESTNYFLKLSHEQQTNCLIEMTTSEQENLINNLASKDIKELINDIAPDDLVDLVQKVSQDVRGAVWKSLNKEKQQETNFLLRFDYDDAAGIMTPKYVKLTPNVTVAQAIKFIRKNIDEVETIYYIYIVDAINRLQGVVSLRDLFRKKDDVKLKDFMETKVHTVETDTDQEDAVKLLREHNLLAIPVVDKFNQILGIVTIDDAINVLSDEHDEDVLKMSAIAADNKSHPQGYLENSVLSLFKSRAPWLAILLLAGTLTSNVINVFSNLIYSAPYLVLFIPVVTSTGGNTATQSTTLMIHGLARNDFSFSQILKILAKESLVALLIGISLALIMLFRSLIFPPPLDLLEAAIISVSLVFVVFFSALVGVVSPLVISRLGADPTVIATPLIATLIDLMGLSIYFTITYYTLVR